MFAMQPPPAPKKIRRVPFVTLCNPRINSPTRPSSNVPKMGWHPYNLPAAMQLNTGPEIGMTNSSLSAGSTITTSSSPAAIGGISTSNVPAVMAVTTTTRRLGENAEASRMLTVVERLSLFRQAEAKYPEEARLFVGNLPDHLEETVIAQYVEYEFSKYGECVVYVGDTIEADGQVKPYAIVQYTGIQEAEHAISDGGKEEVIDGRKVRLEWSYAARRAFGF